MRKSVGSFPPARPAPVGAVVLAALSLLAGLPVAQAQQGGGVVYRCPGNPVLYTDALSEREAREKGCRALEGAPVTVIPAPRPRTGAAGAVPNPSPASTNPSPGANRVDPAEQRARDTDARRILEAELRKEEERLATLVREYNSGEPERRGDERNYQKYLDRVAEMKAGISRKEADIAAIKRELAKLPSPN
jgi:hypothetical protein